MLQVCRVLTLSFAALVACGQAPDEMAIPLDRAGAMFELAERLSATDGGELWGADLYGPMLFVDSKSRAIVANQADGEGLLRQSGKRWVGTMPEEIQLANTSLDWAGVRWTMVLWGALPGSIYEQGKLMMHECFHRLQPQLEFEAASPTNAHLDDEQGRAWLRLEMRTLAEAMIRDGAERKQAAIDALVFRTIAHAHGSVILPRSRRLSWKPMRAFANTRDFNCPDCHRQRSHRVPPLHFERDGKLSKLFPLVRLRNGSSLRTSVGRIQTLLATVGGQRKRHGHDAGKGAEIWHRRKSRNGGK